jgi:hypothetical protein
MAEEPPEKMNPFSEKLRKLRGVLSVSDLAQQASVAASLIYKMESTAKVRWQTVEKCYGHLFRDAHEHCMTLILWALEQTDRRVALYEAAETAKTLLREEAEGMSHHIERISKAVKSLSPVDAELLMDFAQMFATTEPTRQMARAWMAAMKEK